MINMATVCFVVYWIAAVALIVQASPLHGHEKRGSLSIPVTHNVNRTRNGPIDAYRTYLKYGIPVPSQLQEIAQSRLSAMTAESPSSSVPAISKMGDLLWLAPFSIGTPPQELYLDLDTGSSDTWVFSTDTHKGDVGGQTLYDPSASSTSELIDNCTWSILYGDFSTSEGICYKDTFMMGELPIHDMIIESAKKTSSMFTETQEMSGLVGLGFSKIAQTLPQQRTLSDYLPEVLKEAVFTADLKHNGTGSFNFGYIDESLGRSAVEYVNVNTTDGFWSVLHKGFAMGGQNIKYEFQTPRNVIVDTGSTLLFVPEETADYYYEVAGGKFSYKEYGYVLPCNVTPPDFTIEISDSDGNIMETVVPGPYMVYAQVGDGECYGGLQTLGSFSELQGILGDVYLKSGFAVFDIANQKFGMAPKLLDVSDIIPETRRDRVAGTMTHI